MLPPPSVDLSKELRSPMPGVVVETLVKKGDNVYTCHLVLLPSIVFFYVVQYAYQVSAGQAVIILEAMKMRNVLYAAARGVVKEMCVPVGESVDDGATLVIFE